MPQTFKAGKTKSKRAGFIRGGRLIDEQSLQTEGVKEGRHAIDNVPEWNMLYVENLLHVGRMNLASEKPAAPPGIQSGKSGRRVRCQRNIPGPLLTLNID